MAITQGPAEAGVSLKNKQLPVMRYCLYARKSMEAEERQAMSIDSQIKEMQAIADRDHLYVAVTKTEAHSAKNSGEREVFAQVIKDIRAGMYNAILTWNPDRLSRNAGDLGLLVDLMDQGLLLGIRTYGQIFTNSPNDKFLLMILCSQAKLENDQKGINVQRGLRARVEMGLWPCVSPLGYLDSNEKDKLCQKKIDPKRAPIIKQMFEKIAYEQWSGHDLLYWLKEINFKSPNDKSLSLSSVYDVLRRTFYYGDFEYPRGSGNWYKGKHQTIITKELFDLTQKQLSLRSFKRMSNRKSFTFLKLMRCGLCGSGITAEEKIKKLKNGDHARYVYYMCGHGRDRRCKSPLINEKDLIKQLLGVIDTISLDLIGMRQRLEWEIDRWYKLHSFVTGAPMPQQTITEKEDDLRRYAKCILEDGKFDEKREILQYLKSRLILKDKKVYLENYPKLDT